MFSGARAGSVYLLPLLFTALQTATAAEVNRTIDDTYGDSVTGAKPNYLPSTNGVWADATCKGCRVQPDPNQAFKKSWTAATFIPERMEEAAIEVNFTGKPISFIGGYPTTAELNRKSYLDLFYRS